VKTARAESKAGAKSGANTKVAVGAAPSAAEKVFALVAGIWIGISLVKFGNPIIFDRMVTAPQNVAELIFTAWPIAWGYLFFAGVALASLMVLRPRWSRDHWPILLLVIWLFWQFLSSTRTIDKALTAATLPHFVSCGVSLLVGWWALARVRLGAHFWVPIMAGFFYTLFSGFDQQHGGLEAMRKAFYEQPNWQAYPKEYLQKMSSNRIFATFVYPNAFAGAILLMLPVTLWQTWNLTGKWPRVARGVLFGIFGYLALGCLYWSGSKGGWLIALLMVAVWLLHLRFPRKLKVIFVTVGLVLGLAAFFIRFSGYFQKGATSVGARFTYWSAAVETVRERPVFGTGPGTFSKAYARIKPADAEMARLTHNDYLEQASDSGIVGGLTFTGFILLSMGCLYRTARERGWDTFAVWLGLLGWSAQAFIEFGLYIPGLAWPVFLFFGWLWGLREISEIQPSS
jgi:O-antigen ligase